MFIPFFLISSLLTICPLFAEDITVKSYKGSLHRQHAEIHFARPEPGMTVATNMSKNKDLTHPEPFTLKVTEREIGLLPNPPPEKKHWRSAQPLKFGEIIRTDADAFIEFIFPDGTELVAGPDSFFELTSKMKLRFLKGNFEWRVRTTVNGSEQIVLETPNTLIHHRGKKGADVRFGTECFIKLSRDEEKVTTTEIACTHGSVAVDHFKPLSSGVVFIGTSVIPPNSVLTVTGRHGLGLDVQQKDIPTTEQAALVARFRVLR